MPCTTSPTPSPSDPIPPPGTAAAVDLLGLGDGIPGITGVADFPPPDWPWSTERKVVAWLLVLLAAAGAAYVLSRATSHALTRRRSG